MDISRRELPTPRYSRPLIDSLMVDMNIGDFVKCRDIAVHDARGGLETRFVNMVQSCL